LNIFELLASIAIVFIIQNKSGPFSIFSRIKDFVISIPYLGVEVFQLLNCSFCLGFYVGSLMFLICNVFSFKFIIFGLATAISCYIVFSILGVK
jgi:hypothetical protein